MMFALAAPARGEAAPSCNVYLADDPNFLKCNGTQYETFNCTGATTSCTPAPASCSVGLTNNIFDAYCPSLEPAPAVAPETAVTAPNPNLAAQAAAAAEAARVQSSQAAEESNGSNESSQKSAMEVNAIGANNAASVGAIFCAQAANDQAENAAAAAASEYASCKQYFDAANEMKGKNELRVSTAIVETESAKGTLTSFEKNFSLASGDFLTRMLNSGGDRAVLSDMLSLKFDESQMTAMYSAADSASPAALAPEPPAGGGKKLSASLRDSLKKALQQKTGDEFRRPASAETQAAPKPRIRGLEPLHEGIFAMAEESELTIFGVVHLKYQELQKKRDL